MKTALVTGGAGFVGSHVVEHLLKNTDWNINVIDKLTYSSNGYDRLRDIKAFDDSRVNVITTDLRDDLSVGVKQELEGTNYILHLAAESHVDRSIENPRLFLDSNVHGTITMLEYAKDLSTLEKMIHFSTDEVYGTAPKGVDYKEGDRFNTGNPYSASKASAETFVQAYQNMYKLPIFITNTMNIIGERQHPEKYLPLVINKVLNKEKLLVHSNKDKSEAGTRFYIHARNVADGLLFLLQNNEEYLDPVDSHKGRFNIVGQQEIDNLTFAKKISETIGKPLDYEMVDFHSSRPGHDLRYGLDGTKMSKLGWVPPLSLNESLEKTVNWYLDNKRWL